MFSVQNPSTSNTRILGPSGCWNEFWELSSLLIGNHNYSLLAKMTDEDKHTSILKPFHALSKSFFLSSSPSISTMMLTRVALVSKLWSKTFQIDDIKSRAVDSELR